MARGRVGSASDPGPGVHAFAAHVAPRRHHADHPEARVGAQGLVPVSACTLRANAITSTEMSSATIDGATASWKSVSARSGSGSVGSRYEFITVDGESLLESGLGCFIGGVPQLAADPVEHFGHLLRVTGSRSSSPTGVGQSTEMIVVDRSLMYWDQSRLTSLVHRLAVVMWMSSRSARTNAGRSSASVQSAVFRARRSDSPRSRLSCSLIQLARAWWPGAPPGNSQGLRVGVVATIEWRRPSHARRVRR